MSSDSSSGRFTALSGKRAMVTGATGFLGYAIWHLAAHVTADELIQVTAAEAAAPALAVQQLGNRRGHRCPLSVRPVRGPVQQPGS